MVVVVGDDLEEMAYGVGVTPEASSQMKIMHPSPSYRKRAAHTLPGVLSRLVSPHTILHDGVGADHEHDECELGWDILTNLALRNQNRL